MKDQYYIIEEMDGYYRIGSPEAVFCYVVIGTEKAMLIDTGYAYGDMNAAVRSITDKPLYIVNTHGHLDHACGNAQFEEKVYINKKDIELCRAHTCEQNRRESIERAKHSVHYEIGEEYNALPEGFDEAWYCSLGTGNIVEVEDGDIFELGGATMKIVETPGHTRGGISVWYKEKNLVFVGDATGMFVWLFAEETTSLAEYIQALDRLLELPVEYYIGGHNPKAMTKADLELYKKAAMEADFEKGEPFESFLTKDKDVRVCALDGMTLADMFKPEFAAVVISEDKVGSYVKSMKKC